MPNIFSPNGDAVNNIYRPFLMSDPTRDLCSLAIIDVNMSIYNRWGGLIVENACFWDGDTDGGQELAEGVYYYIVDMNSTCNGQGGGRRITGDLTLTR
jgi:gliding motility-associated-like protein